MHDDVPVTAERLGLWTWDPDTPFPLTDAECAQLCRGHPIRWPGTAEDVLRLPGRYELLDGWLVTRR